MALYIYLEPGDNVSWVKLASDGSEAYRGHGALAELNPTGERVVVFVPGEEVLLCRAKVPGQKRRLWAQAVPYALEDQLVDEVEAQHFAFGASVAGELDVAVVTLAQMDSWLAQLRGAGIEPSALYVDIQALPLEEQSWSLYQFSDRCLLRRANHDGLALEATNAGFMLQTSLASCGDIKPDQINYRYTSEAPSALPELEVELEAQPLSEPPIVVLAKAHQQAAKAINLLQGSYSRREQMSKYWRPWRAAAALLIGVVVLQFGLGFADQTRLAAQKQQLLADIDQIYRDAFPQARKVVNAKVQMERALASLQGGGNMAGGFSDMLAKAGKEFQATDKLTLDRISYKSGLLDVSLHVADLQQLDQLKQRLTEKAKLNVDIQSATAKGNQVEARLRIKEAS